MTFERYDEGARQVVVIAEAKARELGHHEIGALHLLLACFDARYLSRGRSYTLAARALAAAKVDRERVEECVREVHRYPRVGDGAEQPIQLPFMDETKTVMERALREALSSGHESIRGEHLLMALTREPITVSWVGDDVRQAIAREWLKETR